MNTDTISPAFAATLTDVRTALRYAAASGNEAPFPVPGPNLAEARAIGNPIAGVSDSAPEAFGNYVVATVAATATVLRLGAPVVPTDSGAVATVPVVTASDTFTGATFNGSKGYAGPVTISAELLEDSVRPIFDAIVPRRQGEAIAADLGTDLLVGSGTSEPQGLVTGATAVAAAGATLATGDFENAFSAVPAHLRTHWIMSTATYFAATALGIVDPAPEGGPGRIYGTPVVLDDAMPSVASAARPVVIGNVRAAYLVRQVGGVMAQVVATPSDWEIDQVTMAARLRADGRVVDATAIAAIVMP